MNAMRIGRFVVLAATVLVVLSGLSSPAGDAEAQPPAAEQTVLGPGMYIYQTRTRSASCNDDERTGYVSSFVAPIHGVPGSRSMRMQLVNSPWWPQWTLTVDASGLVSGDATLHNSRPGPDQPRSHFEVRLDGPRFTGTGWRSYQSTVDGQPRTCRVEFDALLRRIDL
jgi:hypothetical protein